MDLIAKERDRLLQRAARSYGLSFTIVSLLCLAIPGALDQLGFFACAPLYVLVGFCQYRIGVSRNPIWMALPVLASVVILFVVTVVSPGGPGSAGVSAMTLLAGASVASIGISLTNGWVSRAGLLVAFVVVTTATGIFLAPYAVLGRTLSLVILGWALTTFIGFWISAGVPQASRRIASIDRKSVV